MKAAFFAVFLVAGIVLFPATAQEASGRARPSLPANWLSLEAGIFKFDSVGLRYDRDIHDFFSVGVRTFMSTAVPWKEAGALATGRFFPGRAALYFELGLGYGMMPGKETENTVSGLLIAPALGFRIDVGRRGGYFINPFLNTPHFVINLKDTGEITNSGFAFGFGIGGRF